MARFPSAQVDLISDVYVKNEWRPLVPFLRDKTLTITRGRQNEAGLLAPTKSVFVVNNNSGEWTRRNPRGPWFGHLQRNTPLRQAIRNDHDQFDRVVVDAWGTSTGGMPWSTGGTPGVFEVDGTSGIQRVAAANDFVARALVGASYRNVRTDVTVTLPGITNVTGGDIEPGNIMLRRLSSTSYYMVRVAIDPSENVKISLMDFAGNIYAAAITVITGWAGEPLRVAGLIEGHTMFGKVWRASEPEPYGWQRKATIDTALAPYTGTVGIRSGVATGNTNSKPVEFHYTDWQVSTPITAVEITKWPGKRGKSGNDWTIAIDAGGIKRRLGQGESPLRSTLFRGITTQTSPPVAYWPCEEGRNATSIAPGFVDGVPMRITGTPAYAVFDDIAATEAIPELRRSVWIGDIQSYVSTGEVTFWFLINVPDTGTVDGAIIARIFTTGSASWFDLKYHSGGALSCQVYNTLGTLLTNTGPFTFNLNGTSKRLALTIEQNGSAVDFTMLDLAVGSDTGGFSAFSLASNTVGAATGVVINPNGLMDAVALGQIEVYSEVKSLFNLHEQLKAYDGEPAGERAARLCGESNIEFVQIGDLSDTAPMGPQKPNTLLRLLQECEDADGGALFEPVGVLGFGYRTRTSMYNQEPILTTAHGTLSGQWEPVDDDQLIRNDVTATRRDGSSARSIQETGPMSVLPAEEGGSGLYDVKPTFVVQSDTQLPDIAGWLRHLGTVDESRYPGLTINLASKGFAASQALTDQVLALALDDRMVVTDPPEPEPPEDISQLVRGMTYKIAAWDFRVTLNLAPESPWQVLVLDSATARVAPSACVLEDNETSSDTSIDLTTTGTLWTTSAGDMPIPVTAAGEQMLFTAISGAANPQTATATRHMNDIDKEQEAGEPVALTYPPILAR